MNQITGAVSFEPYLHRVDDDIGEAMSREALRVICSLERFVRFPR